MRTVLMLVILAMALPILVDGPTRHDHITIDLKRNWNAMNFSPSGVKAATTGQMDMRGEYPKFSSAEPGARASFEYRFDLPFEMTQYPIFTLKYRARNIDTNN